MVSGIVLVHDTKRSIGRYGKSVEMGWGVQDRIRVFTLKIVNIKAGLSSLNATEERATALHSVIDTEKEVRPFHFRQVMSQ